MVKQLMFATRMPRLVQPVGWPCGTWMHSVMKDVKIWDSKGIIGWGDDVLEASRLLTQIVRTSKQDRQVEPTPTVSGVTA